MPNDLGGHPRQRVFIIEVTSLIWARIRTFEAAFLGRFGGGQNRDVLPNLEEPLRDSIKSSHTSNA